MRLLGTLWSLMNSNHTELIYTCCYFYLWICSVMLKRCSKYTWQSKKILESETYLLLAQKLLILCIHGSIDPGVHSTLVEWVFLGHVVECKEKHRLVFSSRCSWALGEGWGSYACHISVQPKRSWVPQQVPSSWSMGAGLQLWRNDSVIFSRRRSWSHNTCSRWVVWEWKGCLNMCVGLCEPLFPFP